MVKLYAFLLALTLATSSALASYPGSHSLDARDLDAFDDLASRDDDHPIKLKDATAQDIRNIFRKAQFRSGHRRVQQPNANHPSYQYPKVNYPSHHPIKLKDATAQDIRNMFQQARLRGMINRHNVNQRRDLEDDQELSRRAFDCSSKVSVHDITGPELWYLVHHCIRRGKVNQRRGLEGDLDAEEPFEREYHDDFLVERDAYDLD